MYSLSVFIIYNVFKLYSVSIRACNRYQYHGSYITICAYRMFLRLMYTHIHYIILGMLIAYRTKLLSPLSSNTRTSASWLTTPLFIFRLFPGLRICTTLSPWQAVFNTSSISLSFRHCKHTTIFLMLYISLTSIIYLD